jgi:hypothetical protein
VLATGARVSLASGTTSAGNIFAFTSIATNTGAQDAILPYIAKQNLHLP